MISQSLLALLQRVVEEALNEGGQPDPENQQSHDMIDSDLEDEFEL